MPSLKVFFPYFPDCNSIRAHFLGRGPDKILSACGMSVIVVLKFPLQDLLQFRKTSDLMAHFLRMYDGGGIVKYCLNRRIPRATDIGNKIVADHNDLMATQVVHRERIFEYLP